MSKEEENKLKNNNNNQEGNFQGSNSSNPFRDSEQIDIEDSNVADIVNTPVQISTSAEQAAKIESENEEESSSFLYKVKIILSPITNQFLKLGKLFQSLLSKLSDKVQVQSSYKYFLVFLALGLILLFFSVLYIPFILFNPGKLLRVLSFGNIMLMLSFLFYYGSKDFFAFLVDQNRTGIMFTHLLGVFAGIFVSIFIRGYFLQFLLDFILCITTIMFFLSLLPGGQGGIKAMKGMLLGPLLFMFNSLKDKIFGGNNNTELPQ